MQDRRSFPNIDIGLYEGHCFYIKVFDVLANHWECAGYQQRFTCDDRHISENQCTGSQPKLIYLGEKLKHIMNSWEKVFYGGNTQFSWKACRWIEHQLELIGQHIHYALCSHGGERCVVINKEGILIDGYNSNTSTVYQFHACRWHGCPSMNDEEKHKAESRYQRTLNLENRL